MALACKSWLACAGVSCPFWTLALTLSMNALSLPQAAMSLLGLLSFSSVEAWPSETLRLFATPPGSPILPMVVLRLSMA